MHTAHFCSGFGKVYDARLAVANGRRVAIKRMPNVIEKDRLRNQTEIGALKLCKHPNIVDYIAAYVALAGGDSEHTYSTHCTRPTLFRALVLISLSPGTVLAMKSGW